jgi:hypothetical protein
VCATRGWARKGPWGPEVGALEAACLWVASKPLDRHGLTTPLELKLPQLWVCSAGLRVGWLGTLPLPPKIPLGACT